MIAAVLLGEAPRLGDRSEIDVLGSAAVAYLGIAALQQLERVAQLVEVVELGRSPLAKHLEIRRIDEIAHRDSIDRKFLLLDRVANLVSPENPPAADRPEVGRRIDQR